MTRPSSNYRKGALSQHTKYTNNTGKIDTANFSQILTHYKSPSSKQNFLTSLISSASAVLTRALRTRAILSGKHSSTTAFGRQPRGVLLPHSKTRAPSFGDVVHHFCLGWNKRRFQTAIFSRACRQVLVFCAKICNIGHFSLTNSAPLRNQGPQPTACAEGMRWNWVLASGPPSTTFFFRFFPWLKPLAIPLGKTPHE